jgi:class 3 adenylate cyclase
MGSQTTSADEVEPAYAEDPTGPGVVLRVVEGHADPQSDLPELGALVRTTNFLMTDLERSSRRWEREPARMAEAMARHDSLVTATVERAGGRLLKTKGEGDSAFALFPSASAMSAAAVDLQRRVEATAWPTAEPLRLRVVLATGDVHHRDGDVYGLAVCRAARVRGLARGGEIVVTAAAAALVVDRPPAGTTLIDRGTHRLTGLTRPEHVHSLEWRPGEPQGRVRAPMRRRRRRITPPRPDSERVDDRGGTG